MAGYPANQNRISGTSLMPYDPIQGQGHGVYEVPKIALSSSISSAIYDGSWQMTTNS